MSRQLSRHTVVATALLLLASAAGRPHGLAAAQELPRAPGLYVRSEGRVALLEQPADVKAIVKESSWNVFTDLKSLFELRPKEANLRAIGEIDFLVVREAAAELGGELFLLKADVKRNRRDVSIGTESITTGARSRVKDAIPLTIDKIADGVWRLKPAQPLKPGEYCFAVPTALGHWALFDFGVD